MADELSPRTVARVRQEGPNVLLVIDGRGTLMPWHVALDLGRALLEQGHRAEEIAKAPTIIEDQAILTRAGIPIGLAVDPDVAREAAKEAVNNTRLRRYMPGEVRSREFVGAPTVKHIPAKEKSDG